MSETIGEMILPGTYIDVRAEGLIGVGGISTGNVGIVGTANRGPVGEVVLLGSYSEALDTFGTYDAWPASGTENALSLTRALEQLFNGGANTVYAVRMANGASYTANNTGKWNVTAVVAAVSKTLMVLAAKTPGSWANDITTTLTPDAIVSPTSVTLTLKLGQRKEEFIASTAEALFNAVNEGSGLVTATTLDNANKAVLPEAVAKVAGTLTNGVPYTSADAKAGLDALANQPVNIVVVAGKDSGSSTNFGVGAALLQHLDATETDGRERIGVVGADSDTPASITIPATTGRLVVVAPGMVADDAAKSGANTSVNLPAAYTAALVAGRLASTPVQVSLTNKDVPAINVTKEYTRAELKALLGKNVFAIKRDLGLRALKGITTDAGAFKQISVRRIVDYAKAGVRVGSNPYIGRLNNARVRAALKATLDGFLSGMVLDEMLTGYTLDVSATRQQEINGIALVTMTLQPTFSIDFVKVIMNLE
ncbi:MAG TPA: phage tail sheath C-terminal domain-containing protein [Myxococcaceae bacterium]